MKELSKPSAHVPVPFLEHYPEPGEPPHRILLEQFPFRIGRSATAQYIIGSRQVSKEHTEIFRRGKDFVIRDLGSTNGTFVNGQRIQEAALTDGDIIHVAHKEFRFGHELPREEDYGPCSTKIALSQLPASIIRGTEHLRELLTNHYVRVVFQPIVDLKTGAVMGYETLGRGTHAELSFSPSQLFGLATQCNLARELSRTFRLAAVREAIRLPRSVRLFFNIHPSEMSDDALIDSLRALKIGLHCDQQVVLEVHEAVVTDLPTMRRLREQLNTLGIGLAYDDFGAGQARLTELAEVPPDFIKLDRCLIHGIETAPARQDLVRALNRVSSDLGVATIAEGIETQAEADACLALHCRYGQGFLFGRPQPLVSLGTAQTVSSSGDGIK